MRSVSPCMERAEDPTVSTPSGVRQMSAFCSVLFCLIVGMANVRRVQFCEFDKS